jgi:hypothetical protein
MKEDIIKWAREAELYTILNEHAHEYGNGCFENTPYPELERFAALVAAAERDRAMRENAYVQAEREACAKFADQYMRDSEGKSFGVGDAIRARGNT